ncbi:MAG: ribonuclease III [Robiginitomaculum sp.]|nr:ribonuclease III [Robiginitomaculum sp.]
MSSQAHEQALQAHIAYTFGDVDLLRRALTHGSVGDGKPVADNERLEFLGDRVLGLIVSEMLFAADDNANEGQMARQLNMLVRKEACAVAAMEARLGLAIYMSKAEEKNGGREKNSILGDTCEAILAAIYLDGGMTAAKDFFNRFWAKQLHDINNTTKDPKSLLQEKALAKGFGLPVYKLLGRKGPDHKPEFQVIVTLQDFDPAIGNAGSKQLAESKAAEKLLIIMDKKQ